MAPDEMNETLFPYQLEGAQWLSKKKTALLADEMGLGKSAQAIRACDLVKAERVLILCPANARVNWLREFEKFSNYTRDFATIVTKTTPVSSNVSVICSYDLAPEIALHTLPSFDAVVLDEAHYLKNPTAKRTKAILGKHSPLHKAKRVWALSGTPAPNHAAELWTLLYTFGATPFKYDEWVHKFCEYYMRTPYLKAITGTKTTAIPALKSILQPIMLRRKKEEVMKDLPPIHYTNIVVEPGEVDLDYASSFTKYLVPTDRTHELYARIEFERKLVADIVAETGSTKQGMKALEALASSVSTLRRYSGLQKVERVTEIIREELHENAYDKIVIFAVHQDVIEQLRVRLKHFNAVTLYGGTDPAKRQRHIDNFQSNPKYRVFIGNIQAAGTAITLTAAHQVLFIEQDWVPGNNAQAAMRCHRIGQTRPVFVRFVGLANSIDEKISEILKRKTRDLTAIFDEKKDDAESKPASMPESSQIL